MRAFYKLTLVSLSLTVFMFSNFQFDYFNLWLQAVTYLYPHLVICQRAPPYNSENAHTRHLFNNRRFEHSIQYRLSEPIHEKKKLNGISFNYAFSNFSLHHCFLHYVMVREAISHTLYAGCPQCISRISYESTSRFKIVWSAKYLSAQN
jgi:hypothetical protein